jgi:SMODS-associating 2TM, beta-strand rich effector domain
MIGVSGKTQWQIAIAIASALGVILAATGFKGGLRVYSTAGSVIGVLYVLYDRAAWRWLRKATGVPLLDGTWSGELVSTYEDPTTGAIVPPKAAFLVVKQSGSSLTVNMLTDEMSSRSEQATLARSSDGVWRLIWTYVSQPKEEHIHRSPVHRGTGELRVPSQPAERLLGNYYTARRTTGDISFTERVEARYTDFDAARSAF